MNRERTNTGRWLAAIALFVFGGPLLALGVAWSIAAWMPTSPFVPAEEDRVGPRWSKAWEKPPQQIANTHERGLGIATFGTNAVLYAWDTKPVRVESTMAKEREPVDAPKPRLFIAALDGGAAGWPMRCVHWQGSMSVGPALGFDAEFTVTTEMLRERGIIVPPLSDRVSPRFYQRFTSLMRNKRPLPVAVLWPGLVANSVLWGGVLVLLVFGPRAVRRWRRKRRGACLQCGYALTFADGSADEQRATPDRARLRICPECGSACVEPVHMLPPCPSAPSTP